jgi:hypothetical protein
MSFMPASVVPATPRRQSLQKARLGTMVIVTEIFGEHEPDRAFADTV